MSSQQLQGDEGRRDVNEGVAVRNEGEVVVAAAKHVAKLKMSNAKTMGGGRWAKGTRNQITSPH